MHGMGGAVEQDGGVVSNWVEEFLRKPGCEDVLRKLRCSGATVRHAFVIVGFKAAPWSVECYLTGKFNFLPRHEPALPPEVSGVWIISGGGDKGIIWDGTSWSLFDARGKGIEDELPERRFEALQH